VDQAELSLPGLLVLSTHLQPVSYVIKLEALCLWPAIARQWVRDRAPPPADAQAHPRCWRMDGNRQVPHSGLLGLGIRTKALVKDGTVISFVSLIR